MERKIAENIVVDPDQMRLIHQAKSGNTDALGELLESDRNNLFCLIFSRVFNRETAEDLTQTTLMKAVLYFPKYEPRGIPIDHWLKKIARNVVNDYLSSSSKRKTSNLEIVEGSVCVPNCLQPENIVEHDFELERLKGIFRRLAPDQQKVLIMRVIDGCDYDQIADEVGRSVNYTRVMKNRALSRISRMIEFESELEDSDVA